MRERERNIKKDYSKAATADKMVQFDETGDGGYDQRVPREVK